MHKNNKKGFVGLLFNPIVLILVTVVLLAVFVLPKIDFSKFPLAIQDTLFSLKQDYTQISTEGLVGLPSDRGQKENDDWIWSGYYITPSSMSSPTGASASLRSKHNFYGQEVALLVSRGDESGLELGGQFIFLINADYPNTHLIILKPHTLDISKVDVIADGQLKRTIIVPNPTYLIFYTQSDDAIQYPFIGYKAQFSCDLASDEVWIQESFAQAFNIDDVSFPPTKFCKETRPFVLRNIQQGETAITPDPIPSFNRGDILDPQGNIITINYATPNVAGVTQPCGVDQANIKVAGRWVCSQVIKTTTITREIIKREIIPVTDANSFTFNSNKGKTSFNVGSSLFNTQQNFKCSFPDDTISMSYPNPSADCYSSTITYEGKSYDMADKQLIFLNPSISVQYFVGGAMERKDNQIINNLAGTYIFSVINPLDISIEGGLSFKQNDKASVNLKITNNLPSNEIQLKIMQKVVRTNQNLIDKTINLKVNNGINDFNFDINTENLGINEILIQAFYPITADANVLLPSEKIRINVEVLGEQPSIVKFIEIEKEKIITIEKPNPITSFFGKLWLWVKSIFKQ